MGRDEPETRREPLCRLVRFEAGDGVELGGLLYEPARRGERAAIFLHGTGGASIFDSKRTNLLAAELVRRGIAWFPFNNRGAHLIRRLKRGESSIAGGSAHEVIRECVPDIDGATGALRRLGYRDITLVGHSTGANKIAVYDHYKPRNHVRRYVLLAGGDDTGLLRANLGKRRFDDARMRAAKELRAGHEERLVPASLSELPMSWRSFEDMADPDGDYNVFPFLEAMRGPRLGRKPLFRHLRAIRKPSLLLYGGEDEYCYGDVPGCVAVMRDSIGKKANFEYEIMDGATHGFSGREAELAARIARFLRQHERVAGK